MFRLVGHLHDRLICILDDKLSSIYMMYIVLFDNIGFFRIYNLGTPFGNN